MQENKPVSASLHTRLDTLQDRATLVRKTLARIRYGLEIDRDSEGGSPERMTDASLEGKFNELSDVFTEIELLANRLEDVVGKPQQVGAQAKAAGYGTRG